MARLRAVGYHVDCDSDFDTDRRIPHYLPLGAQVSHLADRIREATTTQDAADVLTELTASHDGILAGIEAVLIATADFHEGAISENTAAHLRHLVDEPLHAVLTDLARTRNALADQHAPHPGRSVCTPQVPTTEREASAVCACPPPPRNIPAPPSASAGRRR